MEEMEYRLLDFVEILAEATSPEEKTEVLLKAVDDSCDVVDRAPDPPTAEGKAKARSAAAKASKGEGGFLKLPFGGGGAATKGGKIKVTDAEVESLKYMVVRDKVGMGPLEPLDLRPLD